LLLAFALLSSRLVALSALWLTGLLGSAILLTLLSRAPGALLALRLAGLLLALRTLGFLGWLCLLRTVGAPGTLRFLCRLLLGTL